MNVATKSTTSELEDKREFAARYALNSHAEDLDIAKQIAENKYRKFVERELCFSEITELHKLIGELHIWKTRSNISCSTIPKQCDEPQDK